MKRISTLLKTFSAIATLLVLGTISIQAATLTVDTTANAGLGSLRQALITATFNGVANDIVFAIPTSDPGYDLGTNRFTISLLTPMLAIPVAATTITNAQPQGVTLQGNNTFTIFTLVNSAVVVMNNIGISNGSGVLGGGIFMGDSATLTLNDCRISNNSASFLGGGIYMRNSGTLHVDRTTFNSNSAQYGGAIFPDVSSTVNMTESTLSGNSASNSGGALYMESASTLNATNNTFSGNTAAGDGGAIINYATITMASNTITGNSATAGGGISNYGAAATLNNNIVALNTATTGADLLGDGDSGNPYTGSYNLIGNSDGSSGVNTATNMWGTTLAPLDPKIGTLKNNGGPTFTHALLFNSPALDQGDSTGIIDQRGDLRPFDNGIIINAGDGSDMGAFEKGLAPTAADVSIGGQIVTGNGKEVLGIGNATIIVTNSAGDSWTARSNPFGYFELTDIPSGPTYMISVTHKRYTFDTQTVTVVDNVEGLMFFSIN